jgi:hypothetical protein
MELRMSKHAEYQLRAYECAETAERAHDGEDRLQLLKMAQIWMKLAEQVKGLDERPGPQR